MKTFSGTFSTGGQSLPVQGWLPDAPPQAVLAVVHGMGEHAGRYAGWGQFFSQRGWAVLAYDQPGHGHAPGPRGHVSDFAVLLAAIGDFLSWIEKTFPGLPLALLGHSMGGNQVANYLLRRPLPLPLRAAVLQSAWLQMPAPPPGALVFFGKIMRRLYPAFSMPTGLDPAGISTDPAEVARYRADPLIHDRITPGWFFSALEAQPYALARAAGIGLPLLVLVGTADPIAAPEGSRALARQAGATLHEFEGLRHELHHEPARRQVWQTAYDWLWPHFFQT